MTWWGRVRGLLRALVPVPAAYRFDSPPRPIDQVIAEMLGRGTAPRVGRTEALSVPAVQKGRNMICSVATLPIVQRGPDRRIIVNPLFAQLDPDVANVVTLAQTLEDLLFEGISWWRVLAFGFDGFPTKIRHLDTSSVSVDPPKDRSPAPLPSGIDPRDPGVWVDGEFVGAAEIIRFDSPNPAVLKVGGRAIKTALLLDQAARMYADDPRPQDYFTPAEGADPVEDDEVTDILAKWRASRRRRATAWVPASMKYNAVDSPSPADLQLVELKKQAALEIANALGVDPEDLGISTTSRTYQNATDRRQDRINEVFASYMRAITDRLSMGDVTPRGHDVTFLLDNYMKADPATRWSVHAQEIGLGVRDRAEVRAEEGYAGPPPEQTRPAPAAEPGERPDNVVPIDAHRPAAHAFDSPAGLHFADLPLMRFSVDLKTRMIEGLALPYGPVGEKFGVKYRFARGALKWSDPNRVKLLRDHDHTQPLGRAVKITSTASGLQVSFKVARGPEGDRALELAEDGALDGLSAGVDFTADDATPDPRDSSVLLVRRADLREVSLTAMPAFDDARVTRVAASRTEGNTMDPCATCGQHHAPDVACPTTTAPTTTAPPPAAPPPAAAALATAPGAQTFNAAAATAAFNALAALGVDPRTALVSALTPEQRQVVNPTRLPVQTQLREPAPYRFDRRGNLMRGSHDFSSDVIAGLRDKDQAAYDRAMEFVRVQFDVISTDVNELNPTTNRPEMYVDQRDFKYPVWNAINKGTMADITPFTFPKFNSASGLVAAHVEGTEPTSGTFTVTNQTVTPTTNSGKAKISRETWDQGGNPQISNLIWRQMVKAWFEALEAAAVAVLDAATPTSLATFTAGGGTDRRTLASEMKAALAGLHFVRGGFSMDQAFAQIDLYKHLAEAKDSTGRPLFPELAPQNADGTYDTRIGVLNVNGVAFNPAWALAATGSVAASSYLFDRDSVHGWASAPQRLTFDNHEVANVYIGLWGYKATAISDINGVREIIYDPVP